SERISVQLELFDHFNGGPEADETETVIPRLDSIHQIADTDLTLAGDEKAYVIACRKALSVRWHIVVRTDHAGSYRPKLYVAASVQRQFPDLPIFNNLTQFGGFGLQQYRASTFDFDGCADFADR